MLELHGLLDRAVDSGMCVRDEVGVVGADGRAKDAAVGFRGVALDPTFLKGELIVAADQKDFMLRTRTFPMFLWANMAC